MRCPPFLSDEPPRERTLADGERQYRSLVFTQAPLGPRPPLDAVVDPVPHDGDRTPKRTTMTHSTHHVASSGSADPRRLDRNRSTQLLTGRTPLTHVTVAGGRRCAAPRTGRTRGKIMKKNWSPFTSS